MKSLKQLVVMSAFGALMCGGLHAQSVDLRANIPFDFTVGKAALPAGEYEISGSGSVVALRKLDGNPANAFVMTIGAHGPATRAADGHLDFHRYGDTYFLAGIWSPSSRDGRQIPQTSGEKELAKRLGTSVEATVMAAKK